MRLEQNRPSIQELDISLFLESIGAKISAAVGGNGEDFRLITVRSPRLSFLKAANNTAALLCYGSGAALHPMALLFLRGEKEFTFCHSTLLLDSYSSNPDAAGMLRGKLTEFFATRAGSMMSGTWPDWNTLALKGQEDCRIVWAMKPTLPVAVDVFLKKMGRVSEVPLFPSVYSYNNPYVENLLEVGLPNLLSCKTILVLGTGAGLDAVCIALAYDAAVDATDINPIAVANTVASARRVGKEKNIRAWVSDGFSEIPQAYDAVFFEAPLAVENENPDDPNRYDANGRLLRKVLGDVAKHLNPGGTMYLMSKPDISPYMPSHGLQWDVCRTFVAKSNVAIHRIRAS